jgi:hypothetical protein
MDPAPEDPNAEEIAATVAFLVRLLERLQERRRQLLLRLQRILWVDYGYFLPYNDYEDYDDFNNYDGHSNNYPY